MLTPRMKTGLSVLFLLALTLAAYNAALLPGRTFLPADLLLLTPPWEQHTAELAPGFHTAARNTWDPIFQTYPWRHYLVESLHAGRVPLWNPYSFSGTPFAANNLSSVFYPVSWLYAVLPLPMAFGWVAALHTFLTGVFFLLYGRRMGWRHAACLCGATVWMLCGVQVAWQMWQVVDATLCWLPLALFFWEGWRRTGEPRQAAGMAAALGLSLLAGHLQFAMFVCMTAAAYALFRGGGGRRATVGLAGILVLGAGVAGVQLLATADLLTHSLRTGLSYAAIQASSLPLPQLVALVSPDLLGGARDPVHRPYLGSNNYYEMTVFCGAAPLALAVYGLRLREHGDVSRLWLGLAMFSLLMGCGSPLYAVFYYGVPLFKAFHGPARIFCLFDFAAAMLCALGVQRLQEGPTGGRRPAGRLFVVLALLIGLGYQAAVMRSGEAAVSILTHDWLGYGLGQVGTALLFVALACGLVAGPRRWAGLALPVVAANMLLFGAGLNGSEDARLLYPPTPETEWVAAHGNDGRVLSLTTGNPSHVLSRLTPNASMAVGWPEIGGNDPMPLARYERLLTAAGSDGTAPSGPLDALADRHSPLLDRLNVRWLVAPRRVPRPEYRMALAGFVTVYENRSALGPRVVYRWSVVPDAEARRRLLSPPGPAADMVLLAAPPPVPTDDLPTPTTVLDKDLEEPGQAALAARLARPGILVTGQVADPGWRVSVDGRPVAPLIADTLFLAVPLSAGQHQVLLRYWPASIRLGLFVSCLSWAIVLALLMPGGKAEARSLGAP